MALLKRFFVGAVLLFVALAFVALLCKVRMTHHEAEEIARRELTKYCYREGLSEKDFNKFEISSQGGSFIGYLLGQCNSCWEYPWIFETYSQGYPRREFSVSVNEYGVVSVHYTVEP
ncbi:MAG: hypothetical protein V1746_05930 [bacterium]